MGFFETLDGNAVRGASEEREERDEKRKSRNRTPSRVAWAVKQFRLRHKSFRSSDNFRHIKLSRTYSINETFDNLCMFLKELFEQFPASTRD